ncbi:MAG: hypothetical protein L6Q99_14535 [Planctomycetes bacterium]|nr:hypothetical protein [Planctomycetota bacterium]
MSTTTPQHLTDFCGPLRLRNWRTIVLALAVLWPTIPLAHSQGSTWTLDLASFADDETQGNDVSFSASISGDGRYVAFASEADNLVAGDTNFQTDVFVRDRVAGTTVRASVSSSGVQGFHSAWEPSLSADGNYVSFSTRARLVPEDTNNFDDIYVHDLRTRSTVRVSVSTTGVQGDGHSTLPSISADGSIVVFQSASTVFSVPEGNSYDDIFVHERSTGRTTRVSQNAQGFPGNDHSRAPAISADGRFISFRTAATNLTPGVSSGGQILVFDRRLGTLKSASMSPQGVPADHSCYGSRLSADGRFIAFDSAAKNLVAGIVENVSNVFVRDLATGQIWLASRNSSGVSGDKASMLPSISADGRWVAFSSLAQNLVQGDVNSHEDVFLYDVQLGTVIALSVDAAGETGVSNSRWPSMSATGLHVAFASWGWDLVPGDLNDREDVLVATRDIVGPFSYCVAQLNSLGCVSALTWTGAPSASAGSGFVLSTDMLLAHTPALLIYSTHGAHFAPFGGGFLCARAPLRRVGLAVTSGALPCEGVWSTDFNRWIAEGTDPSLVAGAQVWAQTHSRDSGSAYAEGGNLSNAVTFTIAP